MHLRAAKLFRRILHPNRSLYQCWSCEEESTAFGHQNVVAHHRQVCAAGHTHPHDGSDLRNAHRRHNGVIAEDAAKIVGIGKDIFLQREKNASGIDQVDRGNVTVDGDVLRPDHLFRRHGEKSTSFNSGVIHDQHEQPAVHMCDRGDNAGPRSAAPLFIHAMRRIDAELKQLCSRIDQQLDALTRR